MIPQGAFGIAGYARHCRNEQIAKRVPAQPRIVRKTVLQQACHQRLRFRQRRNTLAKIARGQDSEFGAQFARTSAVIGNRDDGGQIV